MTGFASIATATLRVPDATLYYEVRGSGPLVVLVGAPMDARPFEALADLLAVDHTVLTTDPRGINRSRVDDRDRDATAELRADDLARLITEVDAGPADVVGSSGGAVSLLALVQARPDLVRTAVVHEPPLNELLPEREELRARVEEIVETHLSGDHLGAWRKFLAVANIHMPEEVVVGMVAHQSPQDEADAWYQHARMIRPTTAFVPDLEVLRTAPTRVVVGLGEDSTGELCERTSRALAAGLGVEPTTFPGGHIGFAEDPAAFATRLREVLKG
ncbi:alpha/beta fold hydrolase [Saccharothrix syringae]|uniref:Alpha/beta hydrolase n=1 Tax=Saccharothrix syringae TaxID=103733 RepID=A0A5Q0HBI0_SACSY|nr:alpha/beta hydrolase [Saccharothrix syringae]QFZ23022.1 alpha/beta hydrolase [Saccharothrix syringae]